jgi:hypothetical protein
MASRFCRAFQGSPGPLAARRGGDYISSVKARRTPPAPNPPSGRQATRVGTFSPSLVIRARGCFFTCVLPPAPRREPRLLFKLLAAASGCMISAWSVIALSPQHPTFSRPIWSRMAPRLQGGPLPRRHPPTPLRNAMSYPGTYPTRSSISLILNWTCS